jgi:hypothetical protein
VSPAPTAQEAAVNSAHDPLSDEPPVEADPVDVAEQQAPAEDDDAGSVEPIDDVGEADPADVYEQAIHVGSDEDAWSHE